MCTFSNFYLSFCKIKSTTKMLIFQGQNLDFVNNFPDFVKVHFFENLKLVRNVYAKAKISNRPGSFS